MPVSDLFDHLSWGETIGDFVESFPAVSEAQVVAVLRDVVQGLAKYVDPTQTSLYPTTAASPKA